MKLEFDIDKKNSFWTVDVWVGEARDPLPDEVHFRDYLDEAQYCRIADWCTTVFQTHALTNGRRARRMSFDSFWFSSKRDMEWFVLHWSGVDSTAV